MKTLYHCREVVKKIAALAIVCGMAFVYTGGVQAQTYTKSGTVYEDYNASGSKNTGEPGTNAGGTLYAYLLNNITNVVLQKQAVGTNGIYSFTGLAALPAGNNYVVAIAN